MDAIEQACARIAPLWPLRHFVAVNPFLGFAGERFDATAATLRRLGNIDMLPSRTVFAEAVASGRIGDDDLQRAVADWPSWTADRVRAALSRSPLPPPVEGRVATVAEMLDGLSGGDRRASRTAFMIDEISRFAAAWFDDGQAAWRLPGREGSLYAAWRSMARHDRNPAAMGIAGFRETVADVPADPVAAIAATLDELGISANAQVDYLHRALLDIGGWAGFARYRGWQAALRGDSDPTLVALLAVRVIWGLALFRARGDAAFRDRWQAAMARAAQATDVAGDTEVALGCILLAAYEGGVHRDLGAALARPDQPPSPDAPIQPDVQMAFCIDVRSEVFRRALEGISPTIETLGFAGFFGFAIDYVPLGQAHAQPQCPVLLTPSVTVCEGLRGAGTTETGGVVHARVLRRRMARAWKAFKQSAVSSFAFVETVGLGFAPRLLANAVGRARPAPDPRRDGLTARDAARLEPVITPDDIDGHATGFTPEVRLQSAETVLRAMSLTGNLARLVVLAGHGSSTVNNPHASGLDCGACGGHTGEANARVAAAILNDRAVREGLATRGLAVPGDTVFVAALHDTTTDVVTVYDADVPPTHAADVARLHGWLDAAGHRARAERAPMLGGDGASVAARARDWAQVRPEWGLAGCSAFVAAPRARTRHADLKGRVFLHSYDWRADDGFAVLDLILTAPVVVASWISLQYYASSVNNAVFGSGNKVLHNVTGALGVIEGNAGDLRVGLPLQSVHDGERLVHEPVRLHVYIDAPQAAIDAVLARHAAVRALVDNGWLHLFTIDGAEPVQRLAGGGWA